MRNWKLHVTCPECNDEIVTITDLNEEDARRMEEQWSSVVTEDDACPSCGVLGEALALKSL